MADVGKPTGLDKRGGVFRCRLRYPSDVAAKLGRKEFTQSLRTGSFPEALRLFPEMRAKFDAQVLAARRPSGIQRTTAELTSAWPAHFPAWLTESLALQLATEHFRAELRQLDREQFPSRGSENWHRYVENIDGDLASLTEEDASCQSCAASVLAIELLHTHRLSAAATSSQAELLRAYLRRSMLQIGALRHARLHGDYRDQISDRLFQHRQALPEQFSKQNKLSSGLMLDGKVVDLWAQERKPVQKGIDDHRSAARWFYARVGEKPVDELTSDDFRLFKSKLLEEGKSPANIKQKLSRLSTLMQWAAENGHIEGNAAKGVTIKDTKGAKNKRLPFDLDALQAIFSSPVYATGERPRSLRGEAAYWVPVLALFTGARLRELCQLRAKDISERTYADADGKQRSAWFIHILEDEADSLSVKNGPSIRRVPVHPELERLGFISFVKEAQRAETLRLFPLLRPNKYGNFGAKWGEHWSLYRRNVCRVTNPGMVFHSFRHTFEDYARMALIPEGISRRITGHGNRDIADHYGSGYPDHRLVEAMKTYKVPGLNIPAPDQVEAARA